MRTWNTLLALDTSTSTLSNPFNCNIYVFFLFHVKINSNTNSLVLSNGSLERKKTSGTYGTLYLMFFFHFLVDEPFMIRSAHGAKFRKR